MRRALAALAVLVLAGCGSQESRTGASVRVFGARPVAIGGCDDVYYGRTGRPQLLIVSDLPLESTLRTAMHQMTQAVKLTLKDGGFRAARFGVGYVACSDSGADGRFDVARCVRNARRIVAVANAVAVVGGVDSACARAQAKIFAAAHVAFVGTLATADDLAGDGMLRLTASRSAQAAAAAQELKLRGARTVRVVGGAAPVQADYARSFARAAKALGLRTVGHGRADGAYVLGAPDRAGTVLQQARAAVGRGPIVVSETLGPASLLADVVGIASEGVEIAVGGVPPENAGRTGRAWVLHFEHELHAEPHPYAAYAAQATAVLISAIAASDGSRAGVAARVVHVAADGPLGRLRFSPRGDVSPAVVTFFRVSGGEAEFVHAISAISGLR